MSTSAQIAALNASIVTALAGINIAESDLNLDQTETTVAAAHAAIEAALGVAKKVLTDFQTVQTDAENLPPAVFIGVDVLTAIVGQPFSLTLTGAGGTAPYRFTASALPVGIVLSNGVISGTPTRTNTTSVTLTVFDSSTPVLTDQVTFTITVVA